MMGESWLGVEMTSIFALVIQHEPGPAAAEAGHGGLGQSILELHEITEGRVDRVKQCAIRLAAMRNQSPPPTTRPARPPGRPGESGRTIRDNIATGCGAPARATLPVEPAPERFYRVAVL